MKLILILLWLLELWRSLQNCGIMNLSKELQVLLFCQQKAVIHVSTRFLRQDQAKAWVTAFCIEGK